ncbi:sulfotransferase [Spiribacter vilamensis]|uniref:Sulfotransferase family protein n=1 Tax=Spiribacter vilamensis TaxID=531306 RepID=A0A4Q8D2H5_9GAMM|nr:sulfotransferase [Spiribacter vilamensis]RZU99596.1 sulfotransferase family protein [Spiribacter vilamensis]TVO61438.1 sulfotransferase [Spiribacter vilamensis]
MRVFKKAKTKTLQLFGRGVLSPLESVLFWKYQDSLLFPPVFFLGAPRSGTTLAMQVITDVFDVGYISNQHCKYFGAPAIAEKFFHPTAERPRSGFHSIHGRTNSAYEPAECGQWWYRFFRRHPRYVDLKGANKRKMHRFRRSVKSLIDAFERPVVFKNPHAALRIQPIEKFIPESLYIVVHRDEIDNAHSLLDVRQKVHKDYGKWWSMEPPSIEQLEKLPAPEQVVEQVRRIYATINQDLSLSDVKPSKCFFLKYEDLCDDPAKEMDRLEQFFKDNECQIERLNPPPKPFPRRNSITIDAELYAEVKKYAEKH